MPRRSGSEAGRAALGYDAAVPTLRPFRALRYAPDAGDPSALISPPYDVIGPDQAAVLRARHARNAVYLDLPETLPGEAPEARYRRAAGALAAWRDDGTLRRDAHASIYVYEQAYPRPGRATPGLQRGVFATLVLEPFGSPAGVLPHERTMGGPKADRLALLRATATDLSPIVGLCRLAGAPAAGPAAGSTTDLLELVTDRPPDIEACDDDGVRHRLWAVDAESGGHAAQARDWLARAGAGPITIADGHHRYETALAYQRERPRADDVLALLFDVATTELTILPTHRLVRGSPAGGDLLAAAGRAFEVVGLPDAEALLAAMAQPPERQRMGLFTSGGRAALLLPRGPRPVDVVEALDVSVLAAALETLLGIDAAATAGGRLAYTKDAAEAVDLVVRGEADSAFLLDPTPVEAVLDVAAAGRLMPQKSTYFYPKPATGLVFHVPGG